MGSDVGTDWLTSRTVVTRASIDGVGDCDFLDDVARRTAAPRPVRCGHGHGMLVSVIGRLEKTVFDCPDPRALAAFYARMLGMQVNEDDGDWVVIGRDVGWRELAFQRATPYLPPVWPDPGHPQQLHVDIRVEDVDAAERAAVALGATRLHDAHDQGFRVFADPAGHPFCLVF
ncbi:MAG: hypothetical protein JWQ99_302 [Blastococcus sp.]|jgi:catechol 2,3-dioxygenase-like lactoylglutathione lyase family enzyme|nr:hypothetical protein [Blastococcus sp.]